LARTPRKRRLGSEEARHPVEDEAWVHEAAEGHPGYLKSIRWYSVCLQLSQTGWISIKRSGFLVCLQTGYGVQHGAGREHKEARVRGVYRKGTEEAQSVRRLRKAAGAVGSAPCLVLVPFLKMEPKPKGVQDGSEECQERLELPRKRRLGSEEAKCLAEDKVWVRKALEVQWKCRQPSGSGWNTVGGNQSPRKSAGRNWSETLGLGCQDKSGIGTVAATFLFKVVSKKKKGFGKKNCRVQLPDCQELWEEKRKSLGVPRKTGSVGSGIRVPREGWVVSQNRKVCGSVTIDPRDKWQGDTLPENSAGH